MCKNIASVLLLLFSNNLKNFLTSDSVDSIYIKIKHLKSGYDERYDINNPEYNYNQRLNNTLLVSIRKNILYKYVLEKLEDNNTSIHYKLNIIENFLHVYMDEKQIKGFDLFSGKLLNSFYDSEF